MYATQCNTHILAAQCPCHRLAKTRLADSRRAVKAEDRRLHVALELEYRKILDYPFLYLFESVMILVKHFPGILEVHVIVRDLSPRKIEHELYIVVLYAVVRRTRVVTLQLCHLLLEDLLY